MAISETITQQVPYSQLMINYSKKHSVSRGPSVIAGFAVTLLCFTLLYGVE